MLIPALVALTALIMMVVELRRPGRNLPKVAGWWTRAIIFNVVQVAAVFGPEKAGLSNEDLDHCDTLLTIPTNPEFSSLNLAMAVQVLSYEVRAAGAEKPPEYEADAPLATGEELEHFYTHLEQVLTDVSFLDPDNPRHLMRRLRRLFVRARPDKNEVNILRGILTAVERQRDKPS